MNTQTYPKNPIQAVTHPDPYPYYRELATRRPFYYDEALGIWVAANAESIQAILNSDLCRVRPPAEPVPRALLGSPAADIFQHLVRMNDGDIHQSLKQAVTATLGGVDAARLRQYSEKWSQVLLDALQPHHDPALLAEYAFDLPVYVMSDLLGIPGDQHHQVAESVKGFVRCLSPLSNPAQIEEGKTASGHLINLARSLVGDPQARQQDGLFSQLLHKTGHITHSQTEMVVANGIGFLSQAYEATAGLIGNTILALARHAEVLEQVRADSSLLPQIIQEVLRYDAPIQNTRRFVAEEGAVAGQNMQAGSIILVVLAAANHDPAANPHPDRFDTARGDRQIFTFGAGPHACPGQALAAGIAQAGLATLIRSGMDFSQLADRVSYQESANARIPLFAGL